MDRRSIPLVVKRRTDPVILDWNKGLPIYLAKEATKECQVESLKRAKVKFESETILTRNGADRDLVTPKQSPVRSTNGMTVAVGLLPDPTCTPATVHED